MLSPFDKKEMIRILTDALAEAHKMPTTTPCPLCVHFDEGLCRKWSERIPQDVLSAGCAEFVFNENSPPF